MELSNIFDRYTYLHFAGGIIAHYWGFSLFEWFIVHLLLDIIERTYIGKNAIKWIIRFWPVKADETLETYQNIIGDNISAIAGWCSAYLIDVMCQRVGVYEKPEPEDGGVSRIVNNFTTTINNIQQRILGIKQKIVANI